MTKPEGPYYVRWDGFNWLIHDPQEPEIPFMELDIELLTDRLNKQHAEIELLKEALRDMLDDTLRPELATWRLQEMHALVGE